MKLLILSQYYPPEIGAPQNRLHELAVRLKAEGMEVNVLTALPNYPVSEMMKGYENGKNRYEEIDGIPVHRAWIHISKSKGIVSRILNYFSFVWSSYWKGKKMKHFDYLLVESPPLFLGYSAMALSKKLKAKLIFNVSDLWPESAEKLGIVTNPFLLRLAYRLEAKCYHKACLITGQTHGIIDNITKRFPTQNTYWLPNGVDINFYNPILYTPKDFRVKYNFKSTDVLFFYGGVLGYAQGLKVILQAADILKERHSIHIILQGYGPEKENLETLKKELKLENIHFLPPVPKSEMPYILKNVDVALIPLRKLEIFQGAIPSKIFEALAMEVPLLLGVEGEAKKYFIEQANAGWSFNPEDATDLADKILTIAENKLNRTEFGKNGRLYVSQHFNRDKIASDFIHHLEKH